MSYKSLGHVKSLQQIISFDKHLSPEPKNSSYKFLPRCMANVTHRNACNLISEKSLADTGSETWQFYDYESSLRLNTQSELSQKAS